MKNMTERMIKAFQDNSIGSHLRNPVNMQFAAIGQQQNVYKTTGQAGTGGSVTDAQLSFPGVAGATYLVTAHMIFYDAITPPSASYSFVGGSSWSQSYQYVALYAPNFTVEANLVGTEVMSTAGTVSLYWSVPATTTLMQGSYITYTRTA